MEGLQFEHVGYLEKTFNEHSKSPIARLFNNAQYQ